MTITRDTIGLMSAILRDSPALSGAACVGRSELFDPPGDREPPDDVTARHRQARRICVTCPAVTACTAWAGSIPASRVQGVLPKDNITKESA